MFFQIESAAMRTWLPHRSKFDDFESHRLDPADEPVETCAIKSLGLDRRVAPRHTDGEFAKFGLDKGAGFSSNREPVARQDFSHM